MFINLGVSFLREVDQIILVDDGQIIARGTFDELMETQEKFVLLMAESSKQQENDEEKGEKEKLDGKGKKFCFEKSAFLVCYEFNPYFYCSCFD